MLHWLSLARLETADTRHVYIFRFEKPTGNIVVDGFFADFRSAGIMDCYVVDNILFNAYNVNVSNIFDMR
jgi:hypothetical protein